LASDLGFPLGHPVIENILVHCVINAEGFIDFSGVERELARERRLLSGNVDKTNSARPVTSKATAAHPWRADVVHQQKMQSERQVWMFSLRPSLDFGSHLFAYFFYYSGKNITGIPTTRVTKVPRIHLGCGI
jgi:hypothetical protein